MNFNDVDFDYLISIYNLNDEANFSSFYEELKKRIEENAVNKRVEAEKEDIVFSIIDLYNLKYDSSIEERSDFDDLCTYVSKQIDEIFTNLHSGGNGISLTSKSKVEVDDSYPSLYDFINSLK